MESALRYKKMRGFATTHGQDFEVNMAALLYLRGLNSGRDFQLATNVEGAGALDDVVFRVRGTEESAEWTTMYVQLKHKATVRLTKQVFTSVKGEFSLPKYYKSYLCIKEAMSTAEREHLFDGSFENCMCVIFTDAVNLSASLGERRCEVLTQDEKFLCTDSGSVLNFENDENILKCLGDCGDDGKKFLRSLRVFCSQAGANALIEIILAELRNFNHNIIQGVNIRRLCDIFLKDVEFWWNNSREILHKGHNLVFGSVEKVMLETLYINTTAEYSLNISFEKSVVQSLSLALTGWKMMVFSAVSASSFRLSFTKLMQAIRDRPLVVTCKSLQANSRAVIGQWVKDDATSLVICTNDWSSGESLASVLETLCSIRLTTTNRRIVFLTGSIDVTKVLLNMFTELECVQDELFLFSQLCKQSQEFVLEKKLVFQGCVVKLRNLLGNTFEGTDRYLDAPSVVEVLASQVPLYLGPALDEDISYYIDRSLELANVVKPSVFQDDLLRETITVRVMNCKSSADQALLRYSDFSCKTGLFKKTVQFLSSLQSDPSVHNVQDDEIFKNFTQSSLVHNEDDVFVAPKFSLGVFECNATGLRFGKDDAVTALQVRSSKQLLVGSFIFISDKTNASDAKKLFDFHQSKHVLLLEHGRLRWIQSNGDIESIRRHIDEDQVSRFAPKTAMGVEDRLVLVCAEPGMGKSTLMSRLAKNTKAAFPHYFVILITLNDHLKLFAEGKHTDALGFLTVAAKMDSPLQRSLLTFALEVSGNVVVIANGVDKAFPKYAEETCDFLSRLLQQTKANKVWMTSRNSITNLLETRFSIFAAKLSKFQEEEMKSFLKNIWKNISTHSEQKITRFIDELFRNISQFIQDQALDFLVNPLQTQMLAEVFEDHVIGSHKTIALPKSLTLLSLLDYAFEKKCNRCFLDNSLMKENFMEYREKCIASHAKAALISILGIKEIKRLGMEKMLGESLEFLEEIQCGKEKTGFIVEIADGNPRFSHSVYPDYFVAKWFSGHFEVYPELLTSKMYSDNFVLIRKFFSTFRNIKNDSFGDAGRVLVRSRFSSEYEFTANIAEGGFGTVQKVRNIFDEKQYAVKMVRLRHETLDESEEQLREVQISALTHHDCIARYMCSWIESHSSPCAERACLDCHIKSETRLSIVSSENSIEFRKSYEGEDLTVSRYVGSTDLVRYESSGSQSEEYASDGPTLYLVMECYKGNLRDWLDRRNEDSDIVDVAKSLTAAKKIFSGLEYLHKIGFVHHDIKPANIFVDETLEDVRIGDFGLACDLRTSQPKSHGVTGSPPYAAPNLECDRKSDIYSGGIVFLELVSPFRTNQELSKTLEQLQQEEHLLQIPFLSPEQVQLIKQMICRSAEPRPSAAEVLALLDGIQEAETRGSEQKKDNIILELKKTITEMEQEILELRNIIAEKDKELSKYLPKIGYRSD